MLLKANRTKYIQSQTINSETQYMYCICFQQFWLGRLPEAMQINKLTKFLLYNLRNHYSQNKLWLKISIVSQAKFFFVCLYNSFVFCQTRAVMCTRHWIECCRTFITSFGPSELISLTIFKLDSGRSHENRDHSSHLLFHDWCDNSRLMTWLRVVSSLIPVDSLFVDVYDTYRFISS